MKINLEKSEDGYYNESDFKYCGSSLSSEFIPLYHYIYYEQKMIEYGNIVRKIDFKKDFILVYYNLKIYKSYSKAKNFNNLIELLNTSGFLSKYDIKNKEGQKKLYITRGMIITENDDILYLLCKKVHKNKYRLYLSTELVTEDFYDRFYKKLKKEYLDDLIKDNNLDILITNSSKIKNTVYKEQVVNEPKSIGDFMNKLREAKQDFKNLYEDSEQ